MTDVNKHANVILTKETTKGTLEVSSRELAELLFKAATGKTDKLSHDFSGDFIVTADDIQNLHDRLRQCFATYHVLTGPTVTIRIEYDNGEKQQFSSYEKYMELGRYRPEVTSEFVMKYELIIKLPDVENPQRYILNISIDSHLPLLKSDAQSTESIDIVQYVVFTMIVPSISMSVDYVDYMYAKSFQNIVEDWTKPLHKNKYSNIMRWCAGRIGMWRSDFRRLSLVGAALFVLTYVYMRKINMEDVSEFGNLFAYTIIFYAISLFFFEWCGGKFSEAVQNSMTPTVILLTKGDEDAYEFHKNKKKMTLPTIIKCITGSLFAVFVHVVASALVAKIGL